ncbi:MAG: hypothetical protein K0S88_3117 [Actinomycetia bacterium]|nr:hypothetical protein [Actinomycetes bacterium]
MVANPCRATRRPRPRRRAAPGRRRPPRRRGRGGSRPAPGRRPPGRGRPGGSVGAEVEGDQVALVVVAAQEGEDVAGRLDRLVAAADQGRGPAAEPQQAAVEGEHGGGVAALGGHTPGQVALAQGEPGAAAGEPAAGAGVPGHGGALGVAAAARDQAGDRVQGLLVRDRHVLQAQLVALVEDGRARQGQQQHGRHPGLGGAEPAGHPGAVVVAQHPVGPGPGRERGQVAVDVAGEAPGVPGGAEQLEVERHLDPAAGAAVVGHRLLQRHPQLGQQHPVVADLVDHLAHPGGQLAGLGPVDVPDRQLPHVGEVLTRPVPGVGWVVAQPVVLDQRHQGVDPEPVDPPGQPEAQGVEHRLLDLGVAPVEVGLGVEEHAVVVLPGRLVPAPGAVADIPQPVGRWAAAGPGVAPDVPVALGVVARGP